MKYEYSLLNVYNYTNLDEIMAELNRLGEESWHVAGQVPTWNRIVLERVLDG